MRRAQVTTRVTTWHDVTAAPGWVPHPPWADCTTTAAVSAPTTQSARRLPARTVPPAPRRSAAWARQARRKLCPVRMAAGPARLPHQRSPAPGIRAELQASRLALAPVGGHGRRGGEPFRRTPSQLILPKSSRRDGGHMQRPLHAWPAHRAAPGSSSNRPPERWLSARRSSGRVVNPIADEVSVVSCCPLVAGALICAVMQPPGKA
jgi:hypothetical protein